MSKETRELRAAVRAQLAAIRAQKREARLAIRLAAREERIAKREAAWDEYYAARAAKKAARTMKELEAVLDVIAQRAPALIGKYAPMFE
jgi:hypothetical protein